MKHIIVTNIMTALVGFSLLTLGVLMIGSI